MFEFKLKSQIGFQLDLHFYLFFVCRCCGATLGTKSSSYLSLSSNSYFLFCFCLQVPLSYSWHEE
jgi:hypothetical protein